MQGSSQVLPMTEGTDPPPKSDWAGLSYGAQFAVSVLAGAGLGYVVDGKLHSTPWGTVLGGLAGFLLGLYLLVKELE